MLRYTKNVKVRKVPGIKYYNKVEFCVVYKTKIRVYLGVYNNDIVKYSSIHYKMSFFYNVACRTV